MRHVHGPSGQRCRDAPPVGCSRREHRAAQHLVALVEDIELQTPARSTDQPSEDCRPGQRRDRPGVSARSGRSVATRTTRLDRPCQQRRQRRTARGDKQRGQHRTRHGQ
jgi:hypothetical protein